MSEYTEDKQRASTAAGDDERMSRATAASEVSMAKGKATLTEKDLIRLCSVMPTYVSKALEYNGEAGALTKEQRNEMVKYLYKAWSGFTKVLFQGVAEKGVCIDFPLVGRFLRRRTDPNSSETDTKKYCFVPHIDFVASGRFAFP